MRKNNIKNFSPLEFFVPVLFCFYLFTVIIFGQIDESKNLIATNTFIIMAVSMVILYLKAGKLRFDLSFFYFAPFLIFLLLGNYYAPNKSYALVVTKTYILLFAFSFLFINLNTSRRRLVSLITAFGISTLLVAFYTFYLVGPEQIINSISEGYKSRLGFEFGNPNGLGYFLSYGVLLFFYFFQIRKQKGERLILFFFILLLLFLIIATGSRRAILICLIGIVIQNSLDKRSLLNFIFSALFIYVILNNLSSLPIFDVYLNRFTSFIEIFQNPVLSQATDRNRLNLILLGFDFLKEDPLIGLGTGTYRFVAASFFSYGDEISSHNNFIEIGVNHGFIGLFLYYGPLIVILLKLWRGFSKSKDKLGGLFFVLLLLDTSVAGLTSLTYLNKISAIVIAFSFAYLYVPDLEQKREEI